jgi:Uma2 family endonuclease
MSVVSEKLSRDRFRELYADSKPNFELIDGIPEQKALGSKRHAYLQGILCRMLDDLGFRAGTELTLEISEIWEPVPDVAGMLGPETADVYQNQPPAIVIEILSPSDRFIRLNQKCRRYAEWGVKDILVLDPVELRAWYWETKFDSLLSCQSRYQFRSRPEAELPLEEIFRRLEEKVEGK